WPDRDPVGILARLHVQLVPVAEDVVQVDELANLGAEHVQGSREEHVLDDDDIESKAGVQFPEAGFHAGIVEIVHAPQPARLDARQLEQPAAQARQQGSLGALPAIGDGVEALPEQGPHRVLVARVALDVCEMNLEPEDFEGRDQGADPRARAAEQGGDGRGRDDEDTARTRALSNHSKPGIAVSPRRFPSPAHHQLPQSHRVTALSPEPRRNLLQADGTILTVRARAGCAIVPDRNAPSDAPRALLPSIPQKRKGPPEGGPFEVTA